MAASKEVLDAPDGSALTWIFDHCLRYPGSYEIPLRTMYALNCNPTRQAAAGTRPSETAFTHRSTNSNSSKSSASSQDSSLDPAADFRAQLTHQISCLPSQPCSLPPSFITTFVRRCFAPTLEEVDFNQALTALDYLKDLEDRRKREVAAALHRLGLEPNDVKESSEFSKKYPGVVTWIQSVNNKGRMVEALFTQIYIGLRRWTLINEMMLPEYNKANCIAMLNTLFPPVTSATTKPTSQLTPQILKTQRDGFFRYIQAIDTNGTQILENLVMQGAKEGDSDGWPLARDALDKYLRIANEMIDDCLMVNGPPADAATEEAENTPPKGHKGRKVDSGISFASATTEKLPAPSIRSESSTNEETFDKPLPPSPTSKPKGGSTLERLAREIRKFGDAGKSKNLKKMKSTSALSARPENLPTHSADDSFFEIDDQKRKRLIWEATTRKKSHSKKSSAGSR